MYQSVHDVAGIFDSNAVIDVLIDYKGIIICENPTLMY